MKFRKKPVIVDAVQYTPGLEDGYACYATDGGRFVGYHDKRTPVPPEFRKEPAIKTLEGFHEISAGDWIITGVAGERYPCKPEIFAQTYETDDEDAHELIRDYHRAARNTDWDAYYRGCRDAVEYVLDTLEIKIEGVNA